MEALTIAVAKGRVWDGALPLLAKAGLAPLGDSEKSRKLILPTARDRVRLVVVRAFDVPAYVRFGAADLGITGKDVLLEQRGAGLYELLDLGVARCRMMVARVAPAESAGFTAAGRPLRVATKYVNTARDFFAARGEQTEIIRLYGSMELAPLAGLAECIVDLVNTGRTLRANGLTATDAVADISARLVANKAAARLKRDAITSVVGAIAAQTAPAT